MRGPTPNGRKKAPGKEKEGKEREERGGGGGYFDHLRFRQECFSLEGGSRKKKRGGGGGARATGSLRARLLAPSCRFWFVNRLLKWKKKKGKKRGVSRKKGGEKYPGVFFFGLRSLAFRVKLYQVVGPGRKKKIAKKKKGKRAEWRRPLRRVTSYALSAAAQGGEAEKGGGGKSRRKLCPRRESEEPFIIFSYEHRLDKRKKKKGRLIGWASRWFFSVPPRH